MLKYLFWIIVVLTPLPLLAQQYNFVQYDTKDGLAGSTVYDMCQDIDGFMWFATENGLTRYDGTNFVNYTANDGLPDNEVLRVYPDSRGRIWISTFSNKICYYFKGTIHNHGNTPWLREIELTSPVIGITEDKEGQLLMSDRYNLFLIKGPGNVRNLIDAPFFSHYKGKRLGILDYPFGKGFLIGIEDSAFVITGNQMRIFSRPTATSDNQYMVRFFEDGHSLAVDLPAAGIRATAQGRVNHLISTVDGAWLVDTTRNKLDKHLLAGKKVSYAMQDREGNYWFATLGEGVFKLPSLDIHNVLFDTANGFPDSEVFSLFNDGKKVLCGFGFSRAALISHGKIESAFDFSPTVKFSRNNSSRNKLYSIYANSRGNIFLGYDAFLVKLTKGNLPQYKDVIAIKSIAPVDPKHLLIGTFDRSLILNAETLEKEKDVFLGRTTCVAYGDGKYFIGTLNGLYIVDAKSNRSMFAGQNVKALSRRINDIAVGAHGTAWIATNDAGVVGYKKGKITETFTEENGLSSNICKCICINNNWLFIGTNKGVNRVDVTGKNVGLMKYDISNGLPTNIINDITLVDSLLYIATPKGLTYFNVNAVVKWSRCELYVEKVSSGNRQYSLIQNIELPYSENKISFKYVVVSFKAGGDVKYYYRLSGLDSNWNATHFTFLDYPSIPPGDYQFQLYAENKFGVKSKMFTYTFSVASPYYRQWWFILLIALAFVGVVVAYFYWRAEKIRLALEKENNMVKIFADLEHQALKAQMNPHFIFNCLNAIQKFVLTQENEKANIYLTKFAALVRKTLDISDKKGITLAEEVQFLTNYLDMEKMRFGESFHFSISGYETDFIESIEIPSLLLQPFVENSLRHGIRHKESGDGEVSITFQLNAGFLVCTVLDNGVGRVKSAEFRNLLTIEYQSKGMTLTARRIDLLNKMKEKQIQLEIHDLYTNGEAAGTKVIIKIPV